MLICAIHTYICIYSRISDHTLYVPMGFIYIYNIESKIELDASTHRTHECYYYDCDYYYYNSWRDADAVDGDRFLYICYYMRRAMVLEASAKDSARARDTTRERDANQVVCMQPAQHVLGRGGAEVGRAPNIQMGCDGFYIYTTYSIFAWRTIMGPSEGAPL